MAISPAAKVGLTTLLALVAAGAGASWLTNFSLRPSGYDFVLVYNDVSGLMEGAPVRLMGVKIGSVQKVVPEARQVRVTVHVVDDDVKIVDRSRFMIMSQGIIGEKLLEIFPPAKYPEQPDFVSAGEVLRGDDPARIELVMEEVTEAFREFRDAVDPDKMAKIFNETADNLLATTSTVRRLGAQAEGVMGDVSGTIAGLDRLVANTDKLVTAADPAAVTATVSDMRALTANLLTTYERFFGERPSSENAAAMANLRSIVSQLDKLATALSTTAGDPEVQSDAKSILRNIKDLTARVTQATAIATEPGAVAGGIKFQPRIDGVVANIGGRTGIAGNLQLRTQLPDNYFQLGIEQLGEGNFFNLYFGDKNTWGDFGYHAGLLRSKLGAGLDYDFTDRIELNAEFFDPFNPTMRLGGTYIIGPTRQYGLLAQWARELRSDFNIFFLGLEWRPLD